MASSEMERRFARKSRQEVNSAAGLLEQGEAATGRIEAAIRNKSEGDHRVFNLNLITPITKEYLEKPILCLDRTANINIIRNYIPDVELLASGTPITPHVVINQIPANKFSKTNLEKEPGLVTEIVDFVLAKSAGELALVVTHASIEARFQGYSHIRTLHFGAVAGKDGHGDVRHIFVIGMQQPKPEDAN